MRREEDMTEAEKKILSPNWGEPVSRAEAIEHLKIVTTCYQWNFGQLVDQELFDQLNVVIERFEKEIQVWT